MISRPTAGTRQHHLPAALIGRFGKSASSGRPRDAIVAIRDRNAPSVCFDRAANIGWELGLYDRDPRPDGTIETVDDTWEWLEARLGPTTERLLRRAALSEDLEVLHHYIAGSGVRHLTFAEHANLERATFRLGEATRSQVQHHRVETFEETLNALRFWGIRILHRPDDGSPFVISDFGWAKCSILDGPTAWVWPISPEVAVLGYENAGRFGSNHLCGVDAHFVVTPAVIDVMNATMWDEKDTTWVVTEPENAGYLERLEELRETPWPWLGPYRGRRGGLFD